jgi:hypothetical protein
MSQSTNTSTTPRRSIMESPGTSFFLLHVSHHLPLHYHFTLQSLLLLLRCYTLLTHVRCVHNVITLLL